jgi:superfamily I DNA and/or RNA helicase
MNNTHLNGISFQNNVVASLPNGDTHSHRGVVCESGKSRNSRLDWSREYDLYIGSPGIRQSENTNSTTDNNDNYIKSNRLNTRLNAQQIQAVHTYFRCKVTIVVGIPRTGKSTLIDVILALEEAFHNECAYVKSAGTLSARFGGGIHGLVVDEASQFMEANAAYLILRAHSMGQLRRVLLIGDHNQHPALSAERNPFRASGSVSLIERQIRAGSSHIQLQTQYL